MAAVASDCDAVARRLLRDDPVMLSKLRAALACDEAVARRALVEVLRFLRLVAGASRTLTPSHRVDLAWHELILFTRTYQRLCEEEFGRFLHHTPGGTDAENKLQFAETLRLYRERFGKPPAYFWGHREEAECGGCEATASGRAEGTRATTRASDSNTTRP